MWTAASFAAALAWTMEVTSGKCNWAHSKKRQGKHNFECLLVLDCVYSCKDFQHPRHFPELRGPGNLVNVERDSESTLEHYMV